MHHPFNLCYLPPKMGMASTRAAAVPREPVVQLMILRKVKTETKAKLLSKVSNKDKQWVNLMDLLKSVNRKKYHTVCQ